jgi:pimeloyl-ACP methyl ester carboxylesterase
MLPETRYAKSGDVHIAYQVIGKGPFDLVFVPGFISHVDHVWDEPRWAGFLERLASFSRLICFDKRGTGLSDRVSAIPTLEERMDDVRAVMDAVGSERAALFGISEGGPMSLLFAATYPERTIALTLFGSYALFPTAVMAPERLAGFLQEVEESWGPGSSCHTSRRVLPTMSHFAAGGRVSSGSAQARRP